MPKIPRPVRDQGPPCWAKNADRCLARGHFLQAIRAYRRGLDDAPRSLPVLHRAADRLISAQKAAYGIALLFDIGDAYRDEGFTAKAIAVYRKVLRLDPDRNEALLRLTDLYRSLGLYAEAETLNGIYQEEY